jgi:regulator of nonsense transcripts 2
MSTDLNNLKVDQQTPGDKPDLDDTTEPTAATSTTTDSEQDFDGLNHLKQFISEKQDRVRFKHELKEKNQLAEASRPDESYMKKLDSSIKKITSFIKRLKNLTESQKDSLSKDLVQLNLTKYISEVAAAFTEVKLKMNDINCALHLCSLMHQYYPEFSSVLFECWQKVLNLKKEDKVQNPSKLRVDLRFFTELATIGVLPAKESLSLLGNQLTILTMCDKDHSNLSIIISFCKHCGEDFADLTPTKIVQLCEKYSMEVPRNNLYSNDRQKAVKNLFKEYYRSLCQHLVSDHKEIQKLERQNHKAFLVRFFIF